MKIFVMSISIGYNYFKLLSLKEKLTEINPSQITFSLWHGRRIHLIDDNGQKCDFKLDDLVNATDRLFSNNYYGTATMYKYSLDTINRLKPIFNIINILLDQFEKLDNTGYEELDSKSNSGIINQANFLTNWITKRKHEFSKRARKQKIDRLKSDIGSEICIINNSMPLVASYACKFHSKKRP